MAGQQPRVQAVRGSAQQRQQQQQPQQAAPEPQEPGRQAPRRELTPSDVSQVPFHLIASDRFPLGGRLRHFLPFWRRVTSNLTILNTVMGVRIPFTEIPVQKVRVRPYAFSGPDKAEVQRELTWMLEQEIVKRVEKRPDQFVSPLFLATNSDLTKRPILNVREINEDYLPKLHFKMETLAVVLPLINKGDWFTSWDLRKGFFNIFIHPEHQKYFCFDWEGQRYQFTCLVMGLSVSPMFFSKLVGTLIQLARRWGIQISFYMDDTLLRAPSFNQGLRDTRLVGNLFQQAGFLLHGDKSVQTPTQQVKYLGFIIDSITMTLSLPDDKVKRLRQAVKKALRELQNGRRLTVRIAAKTIGFVVSALPATVYGKAHYRQLEFAKLDQLQTQGFNFDAPFTWPESCREDLLWWASPQNIFAATFQVQEHTTTLTTDASLTGWGAIWGDHEVHGAWENDDRRIDELELRAVLQAIETLPILQTGQRILLRCDNTTAVAYVNNMGGRIFRLNRVAKRIWEKLEATNTFMTAVYIPTDENPADALTRGVTSRKRMLDTEVSLNPEIFRSLLHAGPFTPTVDWFASDLNAQLPRFYVWEPQPQTAAEGVNAFMVSWKNVTGYAFPPFSLIPRILRKIKDDQAQVLLLHPLWPGALWYPSLLEITRMQRSIPPSADVLRYPDHPDLRHPMTDLQLQASWLDGALRICQPGGP